MALRNIGHFKFVIISYTVVNKRGYYLLFQFVVRFPNTHIYICLSISANMLISLYTGTYIVVG